MKNSTYSAVVVQFRFFLLTSLFLSFSVSLALHSFFLHTKLWCSCLMQTSNQTELSTVACSTTPVHHQHQHLEKHDFSRTERTDKTPFLIQKKIYKILRNICSYWSNLSFLVLNKRPINVINQRTNQTTIIQKTIVEENYLLLGLTNQLEKI